MRKCALAVSVLTLVGCGSDSRARPGGPGGVGGGGSGSDGGPYCNTNNPDPNVDQDLDGYTPAQGDCNDCMASVNPGSVEIAGNNVDDDCNGVQDEPQAN